MAAINTKYYNHASEIVITFIFVFNLVACRNIDHGLFIILL